MIIDWKGTEGEIDIVALKKQTDAVSEIYYIPEQEQNLNNARQD